MAFARSLRYGAASNTRQLPAPEPSARPADRAPSRRRVTRLGGFFVPGPGSPGAQPVRPCRAGIGRVGREPYAVRMTVTAGHNGRTDRRDGRSTRWDPHRRERRIAIIEAALAAIEEFGPDALTGQVAAKAGVPRTHVYRHFEGKQALDLAVCRYAARQLGDEIRAGLGATGSARSIIGGAIDRFLAWVEGHPNLYRFLAQHAYAVAATGSPAADDAKAALAVELSALLARYLSAFELDTAPADRLIIGVVGMVDSTAAWWLEHRAVPRAELAGQLTEQVWVIVDHSARAQGLQLDPDQPLPVIG